MDEALMAQAIGFKGRSPPSPPSFLARSLAFDVGSACHARVTPPLGTLIYSSRPLQMMLQDGRMLDLTGSVEKCPSGKELVSKSWRPIAC